METVYLGVGHGNHTALLQRQVSNSFVASKRRSSLSIERSIPILSSLDGSW
jgi:hypothetical protein